jgi:hypothetical protein
MMRIRGMKAPVVAAVAIGGIVAGLSLPAAANEARHLISGSSIKKHSIPGNRLKNHTISGKQVKPLQWHKLTLQNGWEVADSGVEGAPAYAVDAQGLVHLKGTLDGGSSSTAFTLPAKLHPVHELFVTVDEASAETGRLHILPDGTVSIESDPDHLTAASDFTSLEGASFWPGR